MNAPDAVTKALEACAAAGIRTATRPGDVTPPCAYFHLWGPIPGGTIIDPWATVLLVAWIPVRASDDLERDAADVQALADALGAVSSDGPAFVWSSVSIGEAAWPAYRADVTF